MALVLEESRVRIESLGMILDKLLNSLVRITIIFKSQHALVTK